MNKKQYLWLSIALTLVGIAFLVWGGIIYRGYPEYKLMRHIMWQATLTASIQYVVGLVCLIAGYVFVKKA